MIEFLLFIFGFSQVLELLLTLSHYIKSFILTKEPKLTPGTWAVITACTDGIGKGFAESLARRGLNIVQVGRNPSKLSECAKDLNSKYGVEVKSIVKDFSACHSDPIHFFQDIYNQTQGLDIRILVNNVGTLTYRTFTKQSLLEIKNQLALNLFPVVFLTRFYQRDMKDKENSWIINLSSVAAEGVVRGLIIYNSTKSFDLNFTEVLISENVNVMVLQPGYVETPLSSNYKNRPLLISADECCEAALKNLGVLNVTSGHWKHVTAIIWIKVCRSLGIF